MAHAKLFVRVEISKSSGYISITEMMHESDIEERYESHVETLKEFGHSKWETFEGFKLSFVNINVKYDGRKKRISEEDVLKSFENEGLAKYSGSSMFGSYYLPTEELTSLMSDNLNERKVLAGLIVEEVSTTIEEAEPEEVSEQVDQVASAVEEVAASEEDEGNVIMTNQLNQTISNLINSHPNYNQTDIQELDNLAQYADPDTMALIGKFLHTVYYLDSKDSLTFLHAIYSQLDTEEAATHEDSYNATQSYSYTVTDGYIPEPLSGTIEADTPIHADQLIRDIYASELDTTESELTVELYQ